MESNLRFDLTICKETNDLQKEIRRTLQEKGYTRKFERHSYFLGSIHFNTATEYFIKGNVIFGIERDLESGVVSAMVYYIKDGKMEFARINLADIEVISSICEIVRNEKGKDNIATDDLIEFIKKCG